MSANGSRQIESIDDLVSAFNRKGVSLRFSDGQLHYDAPKGMVGQGELDVLRVVKGQLCDVLSGARDSAASSIGQAPLAYSQRAHWQLYGLQQRPAIRQIASATRLRGPFSLGALKASLDTLIDRQQSLRTQIRCQADVPYQVVQPSRSCELEVRDVSYLSARARRAEIIRQTDQLILQPIDVAVDSLFCVQLLTCGEQDHVLILAMEHMVSDALSLDLLLQELLMGYEQERSGRAASISVPRQFVAYSIQQRLEEAARLRKVERYWDERLAGQGRLAFPRRKEPEAIRDRGCGIVPIRIDARLKAALAESCRQLRTTMVLAMFAVYSGLVLRWCGAADGIVRYQSDGRTDPEFAATIGFFAAPLYVWIMLLQQDRFVDLLARVTEEYCHAYENMDFSYWAAQQPAPEFVHNSGFNWVPNGGSAEGRDRLALDRSLHSSAIHFEHPMIKKLETSNEPTLLLYERSDDIVGSLYFPLQLFSLDSMEAFKRNFLDHLAACVETPTRRFSSIVMSTDGVR